MSKMFTDNPSEERNRLVRWKGHCSVGNCLCTATSCCSVEPEEQKREHTKGGTTYFSLSKAEVLLLVQYLVRDEVDVVMHFTQKWCLFQQKLAEHISVKHSLNSWLTTCAFAHTDRVSSILSLTTLRALILPSVKESFELRAGVGAQRVSKSKRKILRCLWILNSWALELRCHLPSFSEIVMTYLPLSKNKKNLRKTSLLLFPSLFTLSSG